MEFSSSSSSSSSSSFLKSGPHFIYDVFINFWGEDISKKFISHLYYALLEAQVKTFINEESLPKELELKEHMRAIAASKIAIIVFSKTYAESSSCLLELEEIIECLQTFGQIVLHVFYDVDPLDVRDQVSDFGKALQETAEKSYSGEQVEHALSRWSRALTTASDSTGWDVRYFEHDAQLVERIVSDVKTFLDYKDLLITPFSVGIDSRVEDVVKCIESQSTKVCMIGICGMRGSGKTTIAKAIYNRIYREFIGKSFTERIRLLSWDTAYKTNIRSQLLHNVLKFKVPDVRSRRTMVDHELSGRKLLIVFDDVNEFGQLEYLCKNREWFGQGTVIIITTRYVRLLNRFKVNYVYKMDVMNKNESLELFSWHAFREPKPRKEFGEVARNTVAYCGGLPLALEVLGSSLYDRIMVEWESISSQIPIDKVQEILKITFDDLTDMEKNIFLDVCCFFIGKERGYVTEILNDCGLLGNYPIEVLLRLGLVKVERNNKLQMHPLLHDIGKEIVRQSCPEEAEKRSRLWFQDDIKYVLKNNTGTEAIEGLSLKLHSTSRDCFETHAFKKMKRLRLLQLDHVQLAGDYEYLSKNLKWICWKGFPSNYIPNNFYMENVIALDLKHSHLQFVWKQPQVLEWLKFLNLSHSKYLRETPDFSRLPSLERLILKDCPSLCKIHPSIGDLRNILLINLKGCTSLSSLPKELYKLKSLRTFILSGCFKIDILEEDIVQMESLITLMAENTAVKQVPYSLVSSKSVAYISLRGLEGLSDNIFTPIIRTWLSPTMNPQSYISPCYMGMENINWSDLTPLLGGLANIRSVLVQCHTEFQLSKQVKTILFHHDVDSTESRISKHQLRFSLIGVGSYDEFFNTLNDRVSEGLENSESCDVSLPGDNHPYWFSHMGEGNSVSFTVPQDCDLKGMTLCVVYLSTPEIVATECFRSIVIANYTKCTLQIHKHGSVISFNGKDWEEIISNLGSGDKVEIFVTFDHELVVKNTVVYLMYGDSNGLEMGPRPEPKENPLNKMVMCDFCKLWFFIGNR